MVQQIKKDCTKAEIGCVDCKKIMAENLIIALAPVREKRKELGSDINRIKDIIEHGNKKARSIAEKTMTDVKEAVKI
jgi:tryptophanyl-tRNA synthetase